METIIKLAGVSYGTCQENIKNFACPQALGIDEYDLVREPDNPADPNAVWVGIGGIKFGYIPRHMAREISQLLKSGQRLSAKFISVNRSPFYETVGLTIKITIQIL